MTDDERRKVARTLKNSRNRGYLGKALRTLVSPTEGNARFDDMLERLDKAEVRQKRAPPR
ncbi:hypothetical protein M8997_006485 [Phyllobacterium sp. 21LDTY02-6]|uniref:hypothetical protein n=1 Tax=Phyllobacterium sp. 21LDTY02-6 TaxID=2944903 RepID=UPI00201FC3C1|nr:hypothetical protein [Phyllobacterium sp. 21LDTY02-6]MCO4316824.1 hypothetical protein [Phyllobacterium sp. 21LDTY02-6]